MLDMTFEKRDLFSMPQGTCFAHCISLDYALGAGIAVEFNKRYNMSKRLKNQGEGYVGGTVKIDNVFNLITKERCYQKPTYASLRDSLEAMRKIAVEEEIKLIAMPKIGAGLDRLKWEIVLSIIQDVFDDAGIEIHICFLKDDTDFDKCQDIKPLSYYFNN